MRRTQLDLDALYQAEGEYRYRRGWNPAALIAFAVPVAINLPGFLRSAFPAAFADVPQLLVRFYDWAWFIGVLSALLIYALLMRTRSDA